MKLTIGPNPLTVSSLGRICAANNAAVHLVKFVDASNGADVTGASASVNMTGCIAGQFAYAPINSVTLAAGGSYYLVSQETQGGDRWYDQGTVSTTNVAIVNSAVYAYNGSWIPSGSSNTSYVPPSFQYSSGETPQYLLTTSASPSGGGTVTANPPAAGGLYNSGAQVQLTATPNGGCSFVNWTGTTSGVANPLTVTMSAAQTVTANFQCSNPTGMSFVTGFALSNPPLRNDFTGMVGMKVTVGAAPLTVSAVGRICVSGNAQTHLVKFANAIDGSDVSGGSAPVNMTGCTPGQFVYASIAPITLAAGSSYYLVSQETQGGDRWYDQGAVSTTSAAVVNNAVYFYNGSWYPINSANTSYAPPNFQYSAP